MRIKNIIAMQIVQSFPKGISNCNILSSEQHLLKHFKGSLEVSNLRPPFSSFLKIRQRGKISIS